MLMIREAFIEENHKRYRIFHILALIHYAWKRLNLNICLLIFVLFLSNEFMLNQLIPPHTHGKFNVVFWETSLDNETATIKYKYSILYPPHPYSAPGPAVISLPVRPCLATRSILYLRFSVKHNQTKPAPSSPCPRQGFDPSKSPVLCPPICLCSDPDRISI